MKAKPRVFFSFRSPFSWLAVERLEQLGVNPHELLEFIPYWEPDPLTQAGMQRQGAELHYVPMTKAKHLYILQDTKRLAAGLGKTMVWPVDIEPWWELSHLGWLQARRLGQEVAFYRAVTTARWERGENISDRQVIRNVCAAQGLDADAILNAADDEAVRAEGVRCLVEAYEDDIFGVPYFRCGWQRYWGYDRVDGLLAALQQRRDQVPVDGLVKRPHRRQAAAHAATAPGTDTAAMDANITVMDANITVMDATNIAVMDEDPLEGLLAEVQASIGAYDVDSAGGCG